MLHLFPGLVNFSESVYPKKKSLFKGLELGQNPHTLFITCSDSRIDPNLLTGTEPGDLFVIRNAGNLIPAYGSSGGEEATIEYAMEGLGIENIIVCGHSYCGAMAALGKDADLTSLPSVKSWLENAHETKKRVEEKKLVDPVECISENVLVQIEHLKTHPTVASRLKEGKVKIFAWVYHFENGDVSCFHKKHGEFISAREFSKISEREVENFAL